MFNDSVTIRGSWLSGKGPQAGIVFSSRIRLARNISGFVFPAKASDAKRKEVLKQVKAASTHVARSI